jgi:HD-GYP domain-containing protein (c-di-GMP phosphodiesterase class II)
MLVANTDSEIAVTCGSSCECPAIRISEVISALSYALDLTEGAPMGHAARACMLGMRLASYIGVPAADRGDLYYALLLKDAGCSSNSSRLFHTLNADEIRGKAGVKTVDWTRMGWDGLQFALGHVATGLPFLERVRTLARVAAHKKTDARDLVAIRCERGASVARLMGFPEPVSTAIRSLDEHWDGGGYAEGLRGKAIPLFSRIALLAQTLEVFLTERGPMEAITVARGRSGRWFDPALVKAAQSLAKSGLLWRGLDTVCDLKDVIALEPEDRRTMASEPILDRIALGFAEIVDAKSPFTYRHSNGVADMAAAWRGNWE